MGRDAHKHRNKQGENKMRPILVELGGTFVWGRVVLSLYISHSHRWMQEEVQGGRRRASTVVYGADY